MKKLILKVLLCSAFLFHTPAHAEDVPIDRLFKEIQQALLDVQRAPESQGLPPLNSATLKVSAVVKKNGGPKFKLWIIEFGKKKSSELVTVVTTKLVPPASDSPASVSNLDISDTLSDALLSVARGIRDANTSNPPLEVNQMIVSLKFGVSTSTNGSIKIELLPVTLSGSGEFSRSDIQEITLVYGN